MRPDIIWFVFQRTRYNQNTCAMYECLPRCQT